MSETNKKLYAVWEVLKKFMNEVRQVYLDAGSENADNMALETVKGILNDPNNLQAKKQEWMSRKITVRMTTVLTNLIQQVDSAQAQAARPVILKYLREVIQNPTQKATLDAELRTKLNIANLQIPAVLTDEEVTLYIQRNMVNGNVQPLLDYFQSTLVPSTSVPPTSVPSTSAPPTSAPSPSALPTSALPTSAPPTSAPSPSAPPTSAPPTSAPPTSASPTSAPPTSAPPTSSAGPEPKSARPRPVQQPAENVKKALDGDQKEKAILLRNVAQVVGSMGLAAALYKIMVEIYQSYKPYDPSTTRIVRVQLQDAQDNPRSLWTIIKHVLHQPWYRPYVSSGKNTTEMWIRTTDKERHALKNALRKHAKLSVQTQTLHRKKWIVWQITAS